MPLRIIPDLSSNDLISNAIHSTVSKRMFLALLISGASGIALMAVFKNYLIMAIFFAVMLSAVASVILMCQKIISADTAYVIPMLVLLFIYTPASWLTFGGLMGCTPYLTILFMVLVNLSYYRRHQTVILSLYTALIISLAIHWFRTSSKGYDSTATATVFCAYVIAYTLILYFLTLIKKRNDELNGIIINDSIRDQLTGLYNRRVIENVINLCEEKYSADKSDYSVMMIDINSFKQINDVFGHEEGDATLVSVAKCIKLAVRSTDYPIRYGGDEYLLILPGARREAVDWIYSRIEAHVGELTNLKKPVFLSVGHAIRSECSSPTEMIKLADKRMYEKKNRAAR